MPTVAIVTVEDREKVAVRGEVLTHHYVMSLDFTFLVCGLLQFSFQAVWRVGCVCVCVCVESWVCVCVYIHFQEPQTKLGGGYFYDIIGGQQGFPPTSSVQLLYNYQDHHRHTDQCDPNSHTGVTIPLVSQLFALQQRLVDNKFCAHI